MPLPNPSVVRTNWHLAANKIFLLFDDLLSVSSHVYQYAFAKSSRDNINQGELRFYKKMAKAKLAMTDSELAKAIGAGELIEI